MNCMLVGVYDRYILIDAGLLFPDFTDYGMQKILPDTSFLSQWKDRIEGVVITHGHEDHIGALPWVIPALDPRTPIFAGHFCMQLVRRRLMEFNLFDPSRCFSFDMRQRFQCGPFEIEPVRVTHSIPDCCGLFLRSEHGNIVHTGDWKIDENPADGEGFDRAAFEQIGREGVTLMMSDSTNALAPGRTISEAEVEKHLHQRILGHDGKGRIILTQFASNLHRLGAVKKAADAAGRKLAFVGMSLNTYLEAAWRSGRAPFDPKDLVQVNELEEYDPKQLLIVTTGSQAEPRSALALASLEASHSLKLTASDLVVYSAKIIPGNDTRVMKMMNRIAELGPEIAMGRGEFLHTSGHAYRGELEEVLRLVRPQEFLPVHGEYAFLTAHAELAQENGVRNTSVIRNGQMLGVQERRSGQEVSGASMAAALVAAEKAQSGAALLGEAQLVQFFNDGNKGTGTAGEMALEERHTLAQEGVVVVSLDVLRSLPRGLSGAESAAPEQLMAQAKLMAKARITTRGMWVDQGRLLEKLHEVTQAAVERMAADSSLVAIERAVTQSLRRVCKQFNARRPEVIVIVHEHDPRAGAAAAASAAARSAAAGGSSKGGSAERKAAQQQGGPSNGAPSPSVSGRSSAAAGASGSRRQPPGEWGLLSQQAALGRGAPDRGRAPAPFGAAAPAPNGTETHSGAVTAAPSATPVPDDLLEQRRRANPRERVQRGVDVEYP